jgi:hypothetical protein
MDEDLQRLEDVKQFREAKAEEADAPTTSLDEVKKELGL